MTPTIATVTPATGPISGGKTITITGSGFQTGAVVTVGSFTCQSLPSLTSTQITCVVPPGTVGVKAVAVTNPDNQTVSLASGFTYVYGGGYLHVLLGSEDSATFGKAVASADLNGDGKAEIIVGAPEAMVAGNSKAGKVYVFDGATGVLKCELRAPSGVSVTNGNFGFSIAVGDVDDADSIPDIHIGEPGATVTANIQAGAVHIFSGDAAYKCLATPLTTAIRTLLPTASEAYAGFGYSVATGLINGNADTDTVVGEPYYTNSGVARGRVTIFSETGATVGAPLGTYLSPSAIDGGLYGFAVTTVDMNGDGKDDVAIGEPGATGAAAKSGKVYVLNATDGSNLFTAISGPTAGAMLGFSLANAGTVNFDNRKDLVIGEPFFTSNQGRVQVYGYVSGATATSLFSFVQPGTAENNSVFGYSVASAGDIDHDGRSDILIGQPYFTSGGTARGKILFYSGLSGGLINSIAGTENNALLGLSISSGDVNGDGLPDILFSEPMAAVNGANRGKVYSYTYQ